MNEKWGRRMNEWHDEVGPFHLLGPDNAPRCGCAYYTTTGPYPWMAAECYPRCGNCARIARSDAQRRALPER